MLTLTTIKEALKDRNLGRVASKIGIHRNTLSAIRSGANTNPKHETLKRLSDYLTGRE